MPRFEEKKKKKEANLTKLKLQPFIVIWMVPGETGKEVIYYVSRVYKNS